MKRSVFLLLSSIAGIGVLNAAPTLWHARQACEDRYCVQLVVEKATDASYIDVRAVNGGPILKNYSGPEIQRTKRGSYETMTVRIAPEIQAQYNTSPNGLLFWVVTPGDGHSMYKSVKRSASAAIAPKFGGSNMNWYRNAGAPNACNREPYGILKTYHLHDPDNPAIPVREIVKSQLADMHAAGQRSIRIGIIAHYGYEFDSYIDASNGLSNQYKQNLQDWVDDIDQAGFETIIITIYAIGDLDPRNWNSFQSARFNAYWEMVKDIFDIFDSGTWAATDRLFKHGFEENKPFMPNGVYVDLGNELMPRATSLGAPNNPDNPILSKFARDLWSLYVSQYPAQRTVGFSSYRAGIDRAIRHMPYIYQNNYPAAFQLHPYHDEESTLQTVDANLKAIGLNTLPVVIGEVHLNDAENAQGLDYQMGLSNRQILTLLQWPMIRGNDNCTGVNAVLPTVNFDNYIRYGF